MWETWVQSLGWEDPLEKEMATHSTILAWRIPWTEEPGGLQSTGSQRVGHDWVTLLHFTHFSHPYMTTGKTIALNRWTFVGKVTSVLFNMLSRLVRAFLPRIKYLLISWLQSPSAVIWESKKRKSPTVSIVSPSICHEVMWPDAMIFVCSMLSFKTAFWLSSFTFIKRLFSSSLLSAIKVVSSVYLRLLMFLLAVLIL